MTSTTQASPNKTQQEKDRVKFNRFYFKAATFLGSLGLTVVGGAVAVSTIATAPVVAPLVGIGVVAGSSVTSKLLQRKSQSDSSK